MLRSRIVSLVAVSAIALMGQAAFAQSATLDVSRFGIYESFGQFSHTSDTNGTPRYDVGQTAPGVEARDYFTFNLSGVGFTVTSATLRINSPGNPQTDPTQPYTLNLSGISTDITTLTTSPDGVGAYGPIFTDLGDGPSYGTALLDPTTINNTTSVDIPLNATAIAAINGAGGGSIGVGGSIAIPGGINQALFFTGQPPRTPAAQLILTGTLGTVAPEPGTVALALVALPSLGLLLRRRR